MLMTEQTGWRLCGCVERKIAQLKFVLLPLSPWGHKYPVCLAGISPEAGNSDSPQLRKTSFLKNVHLPLTGLHINQAHL